MSLKYISYRGGQLMTVMEASKLSEYTSFRGTIRRLLVIVGLWPSVNPGLLHRLYIYTTIALTSINTLAMIGFVRTHFSSVAAVTKGMGITISFLTVIFKIVWMIINRQRLKHLHQMLDPHFDGLLNNPNLSDNLLSGVTMFRYLSWILTGTISFTCTIYVVTPLVFIIYQHIQHIQPVKYPLVYPGVYPWHISPNGYLYKLHYLCESSPNVAAICITGGVDSLFTLYVFQMIGRLREMSHRISKQQNYRKAVRECVEQHEILLECRSILEKVYGPMVLWTMVTNAVILCTLMFQLSQIQSISVLRGMMFFTHMLLKLAQTLMYSWAGTSLTEESEKYARAVYAADWNCHRKFMTSILIMLEQKPLVLTACNFSVVSIDIFIMVLNTTASYFFLLRTIDNEG